MGRTSSGPLFLNVDFGVRRAAVCAFAGAVAQMVMNNKQQINEVAQNLLFNFASR
jgi:hypothetical protein